MFSNTYNIIFSNKLVVLKQGGTWLSLNDFDWGEIVEKFQSEV